MSTRLYVDLAKLGNVVAGRNAEALEAVGRGLRSGARGARALLVRRTPKDNGHLKAAWRDTASRPSKGGAVVAAQVMNDAPYAGIVELGARPHPVSREGRFAILEWVRRHFPAEEPSEQEEIRDAIVAKLRTKGQKPTYFVRDSMDDILKLTSREVTNELRKLSKKRPEGRR